MRGLDALVQIYTDYCDAHGLPAMSAEELLLEGVCTPEQTEWIAAFIALWELSY